MQDVRFKQREAKAEHVSDREEERASEQAEPEGRQAEEAPAAGEQEDQETAAASGPVSWSAYEYISEEKTPDWFWALGIVALAGAVAALLFGNILFAGFIVIGSVTVSLFAVRKPRMEEFVINDEGVTAGTTEYSYKTLQSFWLTEDEGNPKLLLSSTKLFIPQIVLPLGDAPRWRVREKLLEHLPEEEQEEALPSKILEILGI